MLPPLLLIASQFPNGIEQWDPEGLGNHRFVIEAPAAAVVEVAIPWRRRDAHPEAKDVVFVAASTGERVLNVKRRTVNAEFGDFLFEPTTGAGYYYVYYLPYHTEGTNYPKVTYLPFENTADPSWPSADAEPAMATVLRYEAIDAFHAFTEMEVIATRAETENLLAQYPDAPFLVFPEDRTRSIRMVDQIPARWIQTGPNRGFGGGARRGEYFTFQLGLWAPRTPVKDVQVRFSNLSGPGKALIRNDRATCFNTGGIDYRGRPLAIRLDVPKGRVQPLWCGWDVPEDAAPGEYTGSVVVAAKGMPELRMPFVLLVDEKVAKDHGDDDPYPMTRLRWLNSTLAEDDAIVRPFEPVGVEGNRLAILGRSVSLGTSGLPTQIESKFDPRMTRFSEHSTELLAEPMRLWVEDADGAHGFAGPEAPTLNRRGPGTVEWTAASSAGAFSAHVQGRLEFDGTLDLRCALTATRDAEPKDIRLEIPLHAEVARYLMGLGREGGTAPPSLDWKWNVQNNQEGAWVGAVNAGLRFALRDDRYERPLNTNFYHEKPLVMPASWDNGGQGGIRIATDGGVYRIVAFSGSRKVRKGDVLHYDAHLMVTPFKLIDPKRQFSERYFHAYEPIETIAAEGANVVNIHHATEINPWINYPFLEPTKMKAYIDAAHGRGMRVKIYDTIRELSNHAPELFALESLGHEVFSSGKGGGYSWLQEHLNGDYIAAWHVPKIQDAAIINAGTSRWHNYYVEGMDWLARNIGIDGLYLDDVAFDRVTMKRIRKVLDRRRPAPLIDLHSANQHNARDGWNNSTLLYMEHMPFLDRLWFGEYFDYGKASDFWLTEVSGIPFGLMGEMLQDGGNPWRGMVFGMTARRPWAGDPRPLWKTWDAFGIVDSEMIGWWAPDCPVRASDPRVLATVYRRDGKALIALASWAPEDVSVTLAIDWAALGLSPSKFTASPIEGFQDAASFGPDEAIPVSSGKGWLLVCG